MCGNHCMAKKFGHIILLIAVLMVGICNMINVSFCDCHKELIIGSCACEQSKAEMLAHLAEHEARDAVLREGVADTFTCTVDKTEQPEVPGEPHDCHHYMLNSSNWEFPSVVQAPSAVFYPCFAPIYNFDYFLEPFFACHDVFVPLYPPEPERGGQVGGVGYRRPLLI